MAKVHSSAVITSDAQLGDNVVAGPNCVVGSEVSIGSGTVLEANVVIGDKVRIGQGNHFYPNCVIGGRPQVLGAGPDAEIGGLTIGDRNTIREQVTIHRSMYPDMHTRIGNDNLIMIGVHIGHDCVIEDKVVLSNFVQASGHCKIGTGVWLSGMVLLHQFVTIGKWCYAAGLAGINKDVPSFLVISDHYPPKVRGVNKRGLSRAGLDDDQQKRILDAYKQLYRNGGLLINNAKALAEQDGLDENVREMVDMIIHSGEHRYGRYLETFRH